MIHADPKNPSIEHIKRLNAANREIVRQEARIHHFKMNFEEQKQTLLERVRHATNLAQVDESIETFFEKVFDEPLFRKPEEIFKEPR